MLGDVFGMKWFASDYLDNGRFGVIASDSTIVIGISVGLSELECCAIATYHNQHTLRAAESRQDGKK